MKELVIAMLPEIVLGAVACVLLLDGCIDEAAVAAECAGSGAGGPDSGERFLQMSPLLRSRRYSIRAGTPVLRV